MLMVIFGAGASYDSVDDTVASLGDDHEHRPPLARELFDTDRPFFREVISRYRASAGLINHLRQATATVPLEKELERLTTVAERRAMLRRELAALRFYLRRILWKCGEWWENRAPGLTNYHRLLRVIANWQESTSERVCLVSFNYDLMLDHAVSESIGGIQLDHIDGYVSDEAYKILKPHGSVNWMRAASNVGGSVDAPQADLEMRLIDAARAEGGLQLSSYVVTQDVDYVGFRRHAPLFPALTVPMEAKPFEFPEEHNKVLARCIAETTRLLVVGWRATERHFLRMWRSDRYHRPRTQIVTSSDARAKEVQDVLQQFQIPSEVLTYPGGGFSAYMANAGHRALLG